MLKPRKILAIKLRALGDTVIFTAALEELRHAYPTAQIHALVLRPWAPLLDPHRAVDRIWVYDRHRETAARAKAVARICLMLRREHFDCVVNFHASPSSATMAFATGAPIRSIHFHGHLDRNRYSTVVVPGKGVLKPIIERDMDTVRALGLDVPVGRMPKLTLQHAESDQGFENLERLGLRQPVLALGLGSSRPTKAWPIERFAALAVRWVKEMNGGVVAVTGPGEENVERDFFDSLKSELVLAVGNPEEREKIAKKIASLHAQPLRRLAATLHHVAVFAGNDSGPKHIAVAVESPTVTIFGPEDPFEWHPYGSNEHPYFFVKDLSCRRDADPGMPPWCGLETCVIEKHACMREIGIDPVLDACRKVARL